MESQSSLRLALTCALCALIAVPVYADYNGGQIKNFDGTYDGSIAVTVDDLGGEAGAVQVSQANTRTILNGDITISSNQSHVNVSNAYKYAHGVALSGSDANSSIKLKTQSANDRIAIDVYGYAGSGIRNSNANSVIELDARNYTGSGEGILINLHNTTTTAGSNTEAAGIYASVGTVNVFGNQKITTTQSRGYGLWTGGASSVINVTGNTTIETTGAGSYGLRAANGAMNLTGDLTIKTTGGASSIIYHAWGIYTENDATVTVTGNTNITTSGSSARGIYASSGSISVKDATVSTSGSSAHGIYASGGGTITTGVVDITTTGNSAHGIYASGANSKVTLVGVKNLSVSADRSIYATGGGTVTGTGQYTFNGDIYSTGANTKVDLAMEQESRFIGYTTAASNGAIDLSFRDSSNWLLQGDSTLTNLSVDSGSSLTFTINNETDFTKITQSTRAEMEAGATVNIILGDSYINAAKAGDTFQLINAESYGIGNVVFDFSQNLSSGLTWDTHSFATNGSITVTGVPIPEPATCALLVGGMFLVWTIIRRRTDKSA